LDSLTQAVLGASIAGAIAPHGHRRRALAAGALLGTVPDLDVFIDFGGAVENFTYHRGFSHSLFVLLPFSLVLWLALRHWWAPVRESPMPWLAVIVLTLITHPLLDAHTAYGTQLFWPMSVTPAMWATLFIIDPLFTLPLLIATVLAVVWSSRAWTGTVLVTAIGLSTFYLGWSWVAQGIVKSHARQSLAAAGLSDPPIFLTPTPFNTLLWRVVVLTEDGFLEGFDSLVVAEPGLRLHAHASDVNALEAASDIEAVARLRWFADDFVKAQVVDDKLLVSDLRMGQDPTYVFTHVAAVRGNPHWQPTTTELLPVSFDDRALAETWRRIWTEQRIEETPEAK
jgi:inner membrane protein